MVPLDSAARCSSSLLLKPHDGAAPLDGYETGRSEAVAEAVGLIADLEAGLARAQDRAAAPDQRSAGAHDDAAVLVDCLAVAEETRRLAVNFGLEAFAGLDPIPAAGDDDTAFLGSERGHDRIAGVVAPGELGGLLNGGHEGIEEAGLSRSLGGKPAVFEKPRDRRISFLAGDAVDRIGVVTGGDQQALDSGKPRLIVAVIGLLGDVRGEPL